MMESNQSNAPPDLATILATLSRLSGQPTTPQAQVAPTTSNVHDSIHSTLGDPAQQAKSSSHASSESRDPRLQPQGRQAQPPKSTVDPATITTWQDGLRCVTKIAAQNANFAKAIKRMMAEQRAQELRWYSERQELKKAQANRSSSAMKAASILQGLNMTSGGVGAGSLHTPSKSDSDESIKATELAAFDRKIHSAQQTLEISMASELKSLGVPFFGTNDDLVMADGYDVSQADLPESHPKWSPLIVESDLLELRRRMVGHLEDLYRD